MVKEGSGKKPHTARPTPCSWKTYTKFGNKCRDNGRSISEVQEDLFKAYIKKGEKLFESLG